MSTISASAGTANPLVSESPATTPTTGTAENRSIAKAVRDLNAVNYAGEGRAVNFSLDPASKGLVITIINSETKEIITHWPPKYLLELASQLNSPTTDQEQDS